MGESGSSEGRRKLVRPQVGGADRPRQSVARSSGSSVGRQQHVRSKRWPWWCTVVVGAVGVWQQRGTKVPTVHADALKLLRSRCRHGVKSFIHSHRTATAARAATVLSPMRTAGRRARGWPTEPLQPAAPRGYPPGSGGPRRRGHLRAITILAAVVLGPECFRTAAPATSMPTVRCPRKLYELPSKRSASVSSAPDLIHVRSSLPDASASMHHSTLRPSDGIF